MALDLPATKCLSRNSQSVVDDSRRGCAQMLTGRQNFEYGVEYLPG